MSHACTLPLVLTHHHSRNATYSTWLAPQVCHMVYSHTTADSSLLCKDQQPSPHVDHMYFMWYCSCPIVTWPLHHCTCYSYHMLHAHHITCCMTCCTCSLTTCHMLHDMLHLLFHHMSHVASHVAPAFSPHVTCCITCCTCRHHM